MISSISMGGGGVVAPYSPFNNNGYLVENLNSTQTNHLQRVAKQFGELGNKMGPTEVDVKYSIGMATERYKNTSKPKEDQLSTSTDDSNSSGSFKNGTDQTQTTVDVKCDEAIPDHHARRPMNAFLIFCKRHRGIVRERYPNLENRAITKILGDWWANLNASEKSSYTNLAKDYKDAFFNANPDFKWYKLPAPPLRNSCLRTAGDHHNFLFDQNEHDMQPTKTANKRKDGAGMSTFKFADEAQMGGLSSLMANDKCTNNNTKFATNGMEVDDEKDDEKDEEKDGNTSDSKDELQRVLGETNSFLQTAMKEYAHPDEYPFEINSSNDNIPRKRFHSQMDDSPEMKNFELDSPDDEMNGYDSVFGSKKSSRACKGKRYMEFMNAHKLSVIGKRTKPRTASTSSSSVSLSPTQMAHVRSFKKSLSCSHAVQKLDYETFDHLYANHSATILSPSVATKHDSDALVSNPEQLSPSANEHRKFDVNEFELEQKINALQAHNLDDYLLRKQDTKKKKKGTEKRSGAAHRKAHKVTKAKAKSAAVHTIAAPKTIEEAKARLTMVGSQKRKARKESITRRDVQQVTAIVQSFSQAMDPQFVTLNMTPFRANVPNTTNRCGNSGLLMLATMAEVAAANYAN